MTKMFTLERQWEVG